MLTDVLSFADKINVLVLFSFFTSHHNLDSFLCAGLQMSNLWIKRKFFTFGSTRIPFEFYIMLSRVAKLETDSFRFANHTVAYHQQIFTTVGQTFERDSFCKAFTN